MIVNINKSQTSIFLISSVQIVIGWNTNRRFKVLQMNEFKANYEVGGMIWCPRLKFTTL